LHGHKPHQNEDLVIPQGANSSDSRSANAASAELTVGAGATAQAIRVASSFAAAAGVPADVADKLAIVVEEWVANIVEHGEGPPDGVIRLSLERRMALIRIESSDPGIAFDPREVEMEAPNPDRGGGVGLALVKAWTTIERYRFRNGRNEVVLLVPCPGG
jgi:anti-sigma regulatory factor (Ser/Thr protein kinase)